MFSDRFKREVTLNSLSVLLRDKRSRGETVIDLTESNPTRVGLNYEAEEIRTALSSPAAMIYDPDPCGLKTARRAIARYYREAGETVDSEAVFLTASTSEAYSMLFKLLADPGDEILVPRPGYPLLPYLADFENLKAISYPLRYDEQRGWTIDLEVLPALVTPRTRAIVVVSPNNPTGSYVKPHELAKIDRICRRSDVSLICDEVFSDFAAAPGALRMKTVLNRTRSPAFVLNGFSKLLGLPQMKLAWIVVAGAPDAAAAIRSRLEMLLDFYLSVSVPVQQAVPGLLAGRRHIQRQIRARIAANSRFLDAGIAAVPGKRVLRREGGWYAVIEIRDAVSEEARTLRLLQRDNTLVHPGYFYDFNREGYLVVSLLPPEKIFQSGISHLISDLHRPF